MWSITLIENVSYPLKQTKSYQMTVRDFFESKKEVYQEKTGKFQKRRWLFIQIYIITFKICFRNNILTPTNIFLNACFRILLRSVLAGIPLLCLAPNENGCHELVYWVIEKEICRLETYLVNEVIVRWCLLSFWSKNCTQWYCRGMIPRPA